MTSIIDDSGIEDNEDYFPTFNDNVVDSDSGDDYICTDATDDRIKKKVKVQQTQVVLPKMSDTSFDSWEEFDKEFEEYCKSTLQIFR
jgi:hypothetical protein